MNLEFCKYQGTGNDFIMMDNRLQFFPKENVNLIKEMCSLKFGIGADGLILLENDYECDFKMTYYNADGYESTMCGNGGRCIMAFAKEHHLIKNNATFRAIDGIHFGHISGKIVSISMKESPYLNKLSEDAYILDTGSPHYVKIITAPFPSNFVEQARAIRNNSTYIKDGINVNFVVFEDKNKLRIRTYERGVENETFSCGTGAVASAIVARSLYEVNEVKLDTLGGYLDVFFDASKGVFLKGLVNRVFSGVYKF